MAKSPKPAARSDNNGGQGGRENANGTAASKGVSVSDNSVMRQTKAALKHHAHITPAWTPEEQSVLEELLPKYAAENKLYGYAQIAMQLRDKCLRDVVLRCRWMSEKVSDSMPKSTHVANDTNGPPHAQAVLPMDSDGVIAYQAIGGSTGQLLEQNAQTLDQISANFAACKIQENTDLFVQARNNILTVLNNLNDASEIMNQMPPIPVKLNEELINSILQRPPSFPNKS